MVFVPWGGLKQWCCQRYANGKHAQDDVVVTNELDALTGSSSKRKCFSPNLNAGIQSPLASDQNTFLVKWPIISLFAGFGPLQF